MAVRDTTVVGTMHPRMSSPDRSGRGSSIHDFANVHPGHTWAPNSRSSSSKQTTDRRLQQPYQQRNNIRKFPAALDEELCSILKANLYRATLYIKWNNFLPATYKILILTFHQVRRGLSGKILIKMTDAVIKTNGENINKLNFLTIDLQFWTYAIGPGLSCKSNHRRELWRIGNCLALFYPPFTYET